MKKYTIHLLLITIISAFLGFTGLEFPGDKAVRIICLFASIGLMLSCLDAVLVVRKKKKLKKHAGRQEVQNISEKL